MNSTIKTTPELATLVLEDGTLFTGECYGSFGSTPERFGEVVFNTSMSGYQEIITDPSYREQMVCFTYPSIGNYGVNKFDLESDKPYLEAIIVRDYCDTPSNFQSEETLHQYLKRLEIPCLSGVDTRKLVREIRENGSMKAGIFSGKFLPNSKEFEEALQLVKAEAGMKGKDLTGIFSGSYANKFVQKTIKENNIDISNFIKIAALDFGIKNSILSNLLNVGIYPVVFAGSQAISEWQNFRETDYSGFFLSNGPGDPAAVETGIENIRKIIDYEKPIFGICLGHQMLSLAMGAKTGKLKFGHHGGNQPVKSEKKSSVIITAQNHGFSVESDFFKESGIGYLNPDIEINPNDNTVEGFIINNKEKKKTIISVQYHPEAAPGPNDARSIFQEFKSLLS